MEISNLCDVSPVTVRRDFEDMHSQGLLVRTHGGAIAAPSSPVNIPPESDGVTTADELKLMQYIARYISPKNRVFIDGGRLSKEFALFLQTLTDKPGMSIVTNAFDVAGTLLETSDFPVMLVGGDIDKDQRIMVGESAISSLRTTKMSLSVLCPDMIGIDGVWMQSEAQAKLYRHLILHSAITILLPDEEIFGKTDGYRIFSKPEDDTISNDVHILTVMDNEITESLYEQKYTIIDVRDEQ